MECNAIILAGGKSSRMGTDKGMVLLRDKPMIKHILDQLAKSSIKQIIIISNNPEYKQFGYPVFPDVIKDKGPLGGIYTGLLKSSASRNIVLSCDVPFITLEIINRLIDCDQGLPISVVKHKGKVHCLVGIWNSNLTKQLGESLISDKLKVADFLAENGAKYIDFKEEEESEAKVSPFANINSQQELNFYTNEM